MENSYSIIPKYFNNLTQQQQKQFKELAEQYIHWNSQINVISRKDIDELYVHHVLHSLAIAKVKSFENESSVLDVGTGGGFPGIPLAILFPEVKFTLIDSIGKKIKVVKAVVNSIGLKNVQTQHTRVQEVKSQFNYVVSRAVTRVAPFYGWVKDKIQPEGSIFYLKGGNLDREIAELKRPYREINISEFFEEEFFQTKKVIEVDC